MTFKELINILERNFPPFTCSSEKNDILSVTDYYLTEYIALVRKVSEDEFCKFNKSKISLLEELEQRHQLIMDALRSFLRGDVISCYESIYKKLFEWSNTSVKNIPYKTFKAKQPFYRMRANDTNNLYSKEEMFHLPFKLNHKVGNQRFSLSGYPCLYLGTSSYVCWEELDKPDLWKSNLMVLRNERELNVMDLTPPTEIRNKDDLLRVMLTIASSLSISPKASSFKPEYIISQSLLHSIIRFNDRDMNKCRAKFKQIDGILYLSVHNGAEAMFSDVNLLHNFVIPTFQYNETGFCPVLKELFKVSEVKSISDLWIRFPQLFSDIYDENDDYELSVFNLIERYLKGKTVNKGSLI